jgi:hypothetical protein
MRADNKRIADSASLPGSRKSSSKWESAVVGVVAGATLGDPPPPGGVGSAMSAALWTAAYVSSFPAPHVFGSAGDGTVIAVWRRMSAMSAEPRLGFASSISAIVPVTWGAAMLVPSTLS